MSMIQYRFFQLTDTYKPITRLAFVKLFALKIDIIMQKIKLFTFFTQVSKHGNFCAISVKAFGYYTYSLRGNNFICGRNAFQGRINMRVFFNDSGYRYNWRENELNIIISQRALTIIAEFNSPRK